jgi:hypothetical protein
MKVIDTKATKVLSKTIESTPLDQPLFNASPYQYCKRWDQILQLLGIDMSFGLTPGGVRGAAAVYHYKAGKPIQDLLWLMRLRSQTTLESYLQEVSVLHLLAKLPNPTRTSIQCFAALFAFLYAGDC